MSRFLHRDTSATVLLRRVIVLVAALLAVPLLAGCDAAVSADDETPITTLLVLDDGTVVELVLYTEGQLEAMTMEELEDLADAFRIEADGMTRLELIEAILEAQWPRRNVGKDGNWVV